MKTYTIQLTNKECYNVSADNFYINRDNILVLFKGTLGCNEINVASFNSWDLIFINTN